MTPRNAVFSAAALLVTLVIPRPGLSQARSVEGALSAGVLWTQLAGHGAFLVGGQATLRAGTNISIGGFGYGMPTSVQIVEGAAPEDLRLGYGGLVFRVALASTGDVGLDGTLLVGAGNAQVHAQPIGNQLGSDNFLVIEPRLTLGTPHSARLRGKLGAGYRLVTGVQDLPGLDASDLQSWTLTLSISLGGLEE